MRRLLMLALMMCASAAVTADEQGPKSQISLSLTFLQFSPGPAADKFAQNLEEAQSEKGLILSSTEAARMLAALKTQKETKVLAQPKLIVKDGEPAAFLSGVETPYIADLKPVAKDDGTIE